MTNVKKQNVKSFIKDYKVAAFASSSKFLIKDVLKEVGSDLKIVVEQGAGDGVMSKEILKKLNKDGSLILVEQNKEFLSILKEIKDERVNVVPGMAQDFPYEKYLKGEKADLILSSIPFSFLEKKDREVIVKNACENLKPGGKFIIFHQYSFLMKEEIKKHFKNAKVKFEILNLFPCFIILGRK